MAGSTGAPAARRGPPPVHLWNPPFCGDLDMRIAADGTWFYLKTPIGRPALVKLFSSVLKREDGKFFLVTPVEKIGITVDDAPFTAVEMIGKFRAAGVPCAPINTIDGGVAFASQLGLDPVISSGGVPGVRNPITFSETPPAYELPPPGLDEHGEEIRAWLSR